MNSTTEQTSAAVMTLLNIIGTLEELRIAEHRRMYFESVGKITLADKNKLWGLHQATEEAKKAIKAYQDK